MIVTISSTLFHTRFNVTSSVAPLVSVSISVTSSLPFQFAGTVNVILFPSTIFEPDSNPAILHIRRLSSSSASYLLSSVSRIRS